MSTCALSVSDDKKFIIMKITGQVNSQDMYQHTLEAHQLGRSLHLRAFLVDLTDAINTQSPVEKYNFVYKKVQGDDELLHFVRMAMWVRPEDHSHDFIETLANNTGEQAKIFHDPQAAIRFLLEP